MPIRALIVLATILWTGCASFSTHLTPRPTTKGKTELDAHVNVYAYTADDGDRRVFPNVELGLRYGLSDTVDIGGKVNAGTVELNSRIALILTDSFDLGIVPSAGIVAFDASSGHRQAGIVTFGAPILAGVHVGSTTTLLLGAKIIAAISTIEVEEDGRTTNSGELVFYPGGVVGFELMLTDNFALFPELNFHFPYLSDYKKFARPVWQGGLAFQFRFAS
jgi:hypothetical protein